MDLDSRLGGCIHDDDIQELNRILSENEISILMPKILDKLDSIALFGSIDVFNRLFKIPEIAQYFNENSDARKNFLRTVLRCSSLPLVNRIFEIRLFCDEIIKDLSFMVLSVAENCKCAPQALANIQNLTNINKCITDNANEIWAVAFVCNSDRHHLAMNLFLEFPEVYIKVDAMDPERNQEHKDYINTHFMKYYFDKLSHRDLTKSLTDKEIELAYLILLTLIKTYPEKDKIQRDVKITAEVEEDFSRSNTFFYKTIKVARSWREKFLPNTENIHLHRILTLLKIPEVDQMRRDCGFPVMRKENFRNTYCKVYG